MTSFARSTASSQESEGGQGGIAGETKNYRIADVVLSIDPDLYGTEVDNCPSGDAATCGLTDPVLNPAAAFWADFFSAPATLEILAPPQ